MKYLKSYESKHMDNFQNVVDDLLIELRDKDFNYYLSNNKTTFTLKIKSNGVANNTRFGPDRHYGFKWSEISEDVSNFVEFLENAFPKLRFTEFEALFEGKNKDIIRYKFENFYDDLNSIKANLHTINITFLVRFRGNIII